MLTVNLDPSSVVVATVGALFRIVPAVRTVMVVAIVRSRCLA